MVMALEGRELLSMLTVSNTNDSGAGSLRAAIAQANTGAGGDTIVFSSQFNTPQTITLTSGPLVLTDPATTAIVGPGAKLLTISGGGKGRVFDVEGGSVALEGLTITGGRSDRGGGILNDGGSLTLDHVVLRGNRARDGGGLFNSGSATLTDVVMHGNTARVGPNVFSTRTATLTRRGLGTPASAGQILYDNFNGTGGVPQNWTQILGAMGDIQEKPQNLTITDSSGNFAGISSTLPTSVFSPLNVVTTNQAQVNSVSTNGNAVFGLFGLNGDGYLAAGIDAKGVVVIIEQQQSPNIPQTIVPIGVVPNYHGGKILVTFKINAQGVEVTAPGFDSGEVSFSKKLNNFSLAAAFKDGAVPALVGASQPKTKGGSASFAAIRVSTAPGARRR
jgi:hypothetical protein